MSKASGTTVPQETSVDWSQVIGAIDEIGGTLGKMREAALSQSIGAMAGAAERVTPFVQQVRRAWRAESAKRTEREFTADHAITIAIAADKAWGRFARPADGKRTAANRAAVRFINFSLHHTAQTEAQYKGYSDDWDFDAYCDWLPTAWRYTQAGNLIKSEAEAERTAATKAAVKAEVSAGTRMFGTEVLTLPEVKGTQSAADRLVELRSLLHDAQAAYQAAYDAADKTSRSVANTAYKARFNQKSATKLTAALKAAGVS